MCIYTYISVSPGFVSAAKGCNQEPEACAGGDLLASRPVSSCITRACIYLSFYSVCTYKCVYMVPCRRVQTPPAPPLPYGMVAYGQSTRWVLLASSSFLLQVDPTWWLQDNQNHAPTMGVLAPLPPVVLPQHGHAGRALEACKGPSWGQQAYGESSVWVLLASSAIWLQVEPRHPHTQNPPHAPAQVSLPDFESRFCTGQFSPVPLMEIPSTHLSVYLSTYLSTYLSIRLCIYLSVYLCSCLFTYLSTYRSTYLSIGAFRYTYT